jgi:hypothetical protein
MRAESELKDEDLPATALLIAVVTLLLLASPLLDLLI